ncbi:hypothetical protein OU995_17490 [Roseateles sp. SL47]|uniref:hypothetical protein n=1 Tax=Roseateles sp. SL47 TaxID=2995138 RepID=UPI00227063BB|nr:hypothetical protein [Roseateles sp. SL47]WAC71372.1 hypothetical protein OU995_17490 [Roseateles sp. SL47]
MNKYSLKQHLAQALGPYSSTFKATSLDVANGQHLCSDEATAEVYDFDAYVRAQSAAPIPASPDAIQAGHKDLYFVEFKNQRTSDIDKAQMQRKFEAGTELLKGLLKDFSARDCRYHFCVVMKNQARARFMDFRHIEQSAVKFGLDELNSRLGGFYDHVVTESLDFYVDNFKALQCA